MAALNPAPVEQVVVAPRVKKTSFPTTGTAPRGTTGVVPVLKTYFSVTFANARTYPEGLVQAVTLESVPRTTCEAAKASGVMLPKDKRKLVNSAALINRPIMTTLYPMRYRVITY